MTEDIAKLRRSVRVNRVLIVILLLLLFLIIAGMAVVGLYAYRISQQMIPVTRKFMEIDWTWMFDQISAIDVPEMKGKLDSVMETVASVKETVDALSASLPR